MASLLLSAASLATGCDARDISGAVATVTGEPLPGVVVEVASTGRQTLTNALGEYSLPAPPRGEVSLLFSKTGYTPGQLDVTLTGGEGPVQVRTVMLWNLPTAKGVYLYEDNRYSAAKPLEVEIVRTEEDVLYGTTRYRPSTSGVPLMPALNPPVVCYLMPERPPQVARLETAEVLAQDPSPHRITILRPVQAIPAAAMTIDEPAGRLRRVRVYNELEPGVYGIHWGALDGDFRAERRMFLLEVPNPEAEVSPAAADEAQNPPAED